MDTNQYLKRIHYSGERTPTLEVLSELQKNHLLHVPFENLDIYNKIKIDLRDTYDKVVIRNRGGFCYELNGLFYQLLKDLGFPVKMVSARVFDKEKGFGPEYDHMAIITTIGHDNYLVDVGFGEFAFHPLKIESGLESHDPRGLFRMETTDNINFVVKKKNPEGDFMREYLFSAMERQSEDFANMCAYHQTNPESHFTQKRICTLPTEEGRITLTGNTLKIKAYGNLTEKQLANEAEVQQVLAHYFLIKTQGSL
jgi:N-hydroxyarylamine O-acetyltransferase